MRRYFDGEPADLSGIRVDLGAQEPFFARIYAAVRQLGWGSTTTYGALARELGAGPEAARDVGQAMARNPVPLIVPCHRVLAAGGKARRLLRPRRRRHQAADARARGRQPRPAAAAAQASFDF